MKLYKFLSITIVYLFITSCVRTPKEQFYTSPTGSHSYNYNFIEDDKLWQALDSGWISQEVFNLICDLEIKENTYGKAIKKAQSLLDSVSWRQDNLKFPFSLPNNCTGEQMYAFLKYECGKEFWFHRKESSYKYNAMPWDTLLVKYEEISFSRNNNEYDDFYYTTFKDTIVSISFTIETAIYESMVERYGNPLMVVYEEYNYRNYFWFNKDFVFILREGGFYKKLTYLNRNALHSYRNSVRKAQLLHAKKIRLQHQLDSIATVRRLEAEREQARQDSIKNEENKQKLLLEL